MALVGGSTVSPFRAKQIQLALGRMLVDGESGSEFAAGFGRELRAAADDSRDPSALDSGALLATALLRGCVRRGWRNFLACGPFCLDGFEGEWPRWSDLSPTTQHFPTASAAVRLHGINARLTAALVPDGGARAGVILEARALVRRRRPNPVLGGLAQRQCSCTAVRVRPIRRPPCREAAASGVREGLRTRRRGRGRQACRARAG